MSSVLGVKKRGWEDALLLPHDGVRHRSPKCTRSWGFALPPDLMANAHGSSPSNGNGTTTVGGRKGGGVSCGAGGAGGGCEDGVDDCSEVENNHPAKRSRVEIETGNGKCGAGVNVNRSRGPGAASSSSSSSSSSSTSRPNHRLTLLTSTGDNDRVGDAAAKSGGNHPTLSTNLRSELSDSDEVAQLLQLLPRRKRRLLENGRVGDTDVMFSLREMCTVVRSALEQSEERQREQFAVLLQERLEEQWLAFTRYNQDFLTRQANNTGSRELSYLT
uniref:Uncharacterized protein n=1 Tax=Erythrolobus madagascarensis TaxID=708628 RepID=A0A7S0T3E2_9RHOD|mmetsp:Transcript_1366/g.2790  ORF Transcript_1366/g.2790 Transcript_1366/m.2790 type:complete len:274 (+) Transcript_1366:39-860(+)